MGNYTPSKLKDIKFFPNRDIKKRPSANEQLQNALRKTQEDHSEYEYLSSITHFNVATLKLLHTRFLAIDKSIIKDSRISLEEFAQAVGTSCNGILVKRMFDYMDTLQMNSLTFRIFARTMSILSHHASIEEKLKLSFHLYDLNNDGFIDKNELTDIVNDCLPQLKPLKLDDEMIDIIINNTLNGKDKMSFLEYCQLIEENKNVKRNFLLSFSLDVDQLIKYEANNRRFIPYHSASIRGKQLHHGPLQSPTKDSTKKSILKKFDSLKILDQIISVKSVHDVNKINVE
eukprot:501755_1